MIGSIRLIQLLRIGLQIKEALNYGKNLGRGNMSTEQKPETRRNGLNLARSVLPELGIRPFTIPTILHQFREERIDEIGRVKRICVDLDGVICEYNFSNIVKDFFGVDLTKYQIYAYDLADVLGVAPVLIDNMFKEQVYGKPNLIEGAIDTLKNWKSKGYEVIIYSNRVKYMGYDTLTHWLIDWQIPFSGIDDGRGKYAVHIDDCPAKLMTVNSELKLLYNQPWNKQCLNITKELKRVYSWNDIKQKVS